jgi:hypothetical protein
VNYDYKVGDEDKVEKEGFLCKAESKYGKEPWTIMIVHTNRTTRIQCGAKLERLNIWRVTPFTEGVAL